MKGALARGLVSQGWAVLIAMAIFANFFVGRPEGWLLPVASHFEVQSATLLKSGYIEYRLTAVKNRACEFVGQRIFYTAGGYAIPAMRRKNPEDHDGTRPTGKQVVFWQLAIPPNYYNAPITVVMQHKCFGPALWATRTVQTLQFNGPLGTE